jgi:histone acetyltransferase
LRYFDGQSFAGFAFFAISYSEQVKCFGTILMNCLKNLVKGSRIRFFLTYADNFTIGYFFLKQGFTTRVEQSIPERVWKGYIKDYNGGTLWRAS